VRELADRQDALLVTTQEHAAEDSPAGLSGASSG
jgi:hypothetical protein